MSSRVRFRDLTRGEIDLLKRAGIINGCGPKLRWANYLVPDRIFGLHVEEDCDHHDFNYWLGHTEADRVKADYQFYERMRERALAQTEPWWRRWLRPLYLLVARIYHWAVSRWGADYGEFHYADAARTRADLDSTLASIDA